MWKKCGMWNDLQQPIDHSFPYLIQHNCDEWKFLAILFGTVGHSSFFQPQHISSQFFHIRYIISTVVSHFSPLSFKTWNHGTPHRAHIATHSASYRGRLRGRQAGRVCRPWGRGCGTSNWRRAAASSSPRSSGPRSAGRSCPPAPRWSSIRTRSWPCCREERPLHRPYDTNLSLLCYILFGTNLSQLTKSVRVASLWMEWGR